MKTWLGLAILAAAGCGSNGTGDVDSFITSMASAECDWEFRCCTDPEIKQAYDSKYATMEDCVPYWTLKFENQLFLDRLAVREGRLKVESAHAAACLGQLTSKQCNPKPGAVIPPVDPMMMDACLNVFIGSTAVGDSCIYTHECVDGARCVGDAEAVARGVCVPYQEENDICNSDADCDPKVIDLYCALDDYHCHVRSPLGGQCAYTTDSGTKSLPLRLECKTKPNNLYCDAVSSTCKQLPSDGEACLSPLPPGVSSACDPDPALQLVCDASGGGSTGVCRAPGNVGDDCSTRACATGLYCDSSTTVRICKSLPDFGQDCSFSGTCKKPYYCNFSKSPAVCDQPASVGEDCTSVTCDTGLTCDPTTRLCKTLLPDGANCVSSSDCASFDCNFSAGNTTQRTCQPHVVTVTVQCIGRTS
jgi:hypothetical protein